MSGTLFVVATPIGNLGDLSPRAVETLKSVKLVLAEDTRHSRPLLEQFGIHAKLVSCHQHNEGERVALVDEVLRAGDDVALISDAGAPGVSDPGCRLVDGVSARGFAVVVVPGPSAVISALMGAGLVSTRFAFLGFLPKRAGVRARIVESAARAELALVIFEAPQRVESTLTDLANVLGPRRVVVARELTKKFETFHRGALGGALNPPYEPRGEIVIVVESADHVATDSESEGEDALVKRLRQESARPPKDRVKELAKRTGLARKDAYRLLFLDGESGDARRALDVAPSRETTSSPSSGEDE